MIREKLRRKDEGEKKIKEKKNEDEKMKQKGKKV